MLLKKRIKVLNNERNQDEGLDRKYNFQIFQIDDKTHIGEKFRPSSLTFPKMTNLSFASLKKSLKDPDSRKKNLKKKFVKIYFRILTKTPVSYKCFSSGKIFF